MLLKILLFCFYSSLMQAASMTILSNPKPLTINEAVAGQEPSCMTDISSSYSIYIPPNRRGSILAALDTPMAPHTTIQVLLEAPSGASCLSLKSLNTVPQMLVTDLREGLNENLLITYKYSASVAAGVIPPHTKTIIFTLLESEIRN